MFISKCPESQSSFYSLKSYYQIFVYFLTETRQLFDAPVRVFAPVAESGVDLCDYMFQDEKTEEVLERIKELTDVDVETDKLELDCERPASMCQKLFVAICTFMHTWTHYANRYGVEFMEHKKNPTDMHTHTHILFLITHMYMHTYEYFLIQMCF